MQEVPQGGYQETPLPEEYVSGEQYREALQQLQHASSGTRSLTWKQKAGAGFLVVFGMSAFILWIMRFSDTLVAQDDARGSSQTTGEQENLKTKDTDKDGINDYDELNVYATSPYLDDTDSDGIKDKSEIDSGENPTCPRGQNCFAASETVGSGLENDQSQGTPAKPANVVTPTLGSNFIPEDKQVEQLFSGTLDAQGLRALLQSAGMSKEMLDGITDEQLIQTYKKTVESQSGQPAESKTP